MVIPLCGWGYSLLALTGCVLQLPNEYWLSFLWVSTASSFKLNWLFLQKRLWLWILLKMLGHFGLRLPKYALGTSRWGIQGGLHLYSLRNPLEQIASGNVFLGQEMAIKHLLTYVISNVIVQVNKQFLIICLVFLCKYLGVRQPFNSFIN